jgi:hypothetical protein
MDTELFLKEIWLQIKYQQFMFTTLWSSGQSY